MKKKNIFRAGVALATLSTLSLGSCLEDTLPYGGTVVAEQVMTTPSAAKSLVAGMPAYLNVPSGAGSHWDFGYGTWMHVRDLMVDDVLRSSANYNHLAGYAELKYFSREYRLNQLPWNWFTKGINTANNVLRAIDPEKALDQQKGYYAVALAYRAMYYIELMGQYEWMPSAAQPQGISPEGNNIEGLTVPITTEKTTEAEAKATPRATRQQMLEFLEKDLKKALEWIDYYQADAAAGSTEGENKDQAQTSSSAGKNMPQKDAVYGLLARLYLWVENYPEAARYARLAIDAPHNNVKVLTEAEALNTNTGNNNAGANHWMWAVLQTKESLNGNLINWTSWLCNEFDPGYCAIDATPIAIDAKMYARISDTDWRKKQWKAPKGGKLEGATPWIKAKIGEQMPAYASVKFRPAQGNTELWSTACVVDYPLMRIEEMYFIEAEAVAHTDPARGMQLLKTFMTTYRDPQYQSTATSKEDVIDEIFFQKRVELWGEGRVFFDWKRLNYGINRGYPGTNHLQDERYNIEGRPRWFSWQFVRTEEETNQKLRGFNNPNSDATVYTPWVDAGGQ